MKKFICLMAGYLAAVTVLEAQVLYSGGTYNQNFNTLSQDTNTGVLDFSDPWTDNSTLTGWYSNQSTYTTEPGPLGLTLGVGVTNSLTSMGSGSDRALGSYLGLLSLGAPVTHGVRIENNLGTPMTQFTLSFDLESAASGLGGIVALDVVDAFAISYSSTASDVSGLGATGYQLINGDANLLSLNLLGSGSDTRRLEVTIGGLNIAQGDDLWIRWDRASLIGVVDNTLAIDNVGFSAVPEPGTYALLGLGLLVLVLFRKRSLAGKMSDRNGATGLTVLLIVVSLTLPIQAQNGSSSTSLEETVVRPAASEQSVSVTSEKGKETGSARTHEYRPQWNRMMLLKDFESTYKTEIEKGEILVMDSSRYFKSVNNYHVSTGNGSIPPAVVWLRHESYLIRSENTGSRPEMSESPIARPDTLMPVLESSVLLGKESLTEKEYFDKLFYLRAELMETTENINKLLESWDSGSISPQGLATLQSAGKVEWLVCCHLIPQYGEIENLLDSIYRQVDIRLNSDAMTPAMNAFSGL